ncbi:MAG TPA: OmpH family outer membrane protein [Candidatus Ozemobacteraceae bacterium]|nr:OmpH family outer membrane protein [Candidatus Ozemobacteraceae bacterium]
MKKALLHLGLAAGLLVLPSACAAFSFGYVDAGKLFAKYSETQKTKSYLETEKTKLQKDLDTRKKQVSDLDAKYVEIAKKMQDLRDAKKENDARALEPQLRAQREALANANSELQKFFEESQKRLYELEEEKMGGLSKALDDKVDAVIARIAKAKSLEAVFEKRFCYFGGEDITEDVIAALNGGAAAPAAAAPAAAPAQKKGK